MSSTKSLVAIPDVYVPFEPETKAMRGFAFVTFTDSRDAFAAVDAMDGHAALSSIPTFSTAAAHVKTLLLAHTDVMWDSAQPGLLVCHAGRRSSGARSLSTSRARARPTSRSSTIPVSTPLQCRSDCEQCSSSVQLQRPLRSSYPARHRTVRSWYRVQPW